MPPAQNVGAMAPLGQKEPTGQAVQLALLALKKKPAGQQALAPTKLNVPAGQAVQFAAPGSLNVPSAQSVQFAAPATENAPAGHAAQAPPSKLLLPSEHAVQFSAKVAPAALAPPSPAGHFEHSVAFVKPDTLPKVPIGHGTAGCMPPAQKVPAAQGMQRSGGGVK